MHTPARIATLLLLLLIPAAIALAQDLSRSKEPTGSIKGRILIDSRAAAGVSVALLPYDFSPQMQVVAKTTTDEEGRFQLAGVRGGRYLLQTFAPAYAPLPGEIGRPGKTIFIAEDETVEGRYRILARAVADDEITSDARPAAWDAEGRRKLRSEAETAGAVIELNPCQKMVDYLLPVPSTVRKPD